MKPRVLVCFVLALVLARLTDAAESDSKSSLKIILLPTVQYAHGDIWYHTPSGTQPTFAVAHEIAPGQRLDLLLLVGGYKPDSSGRAHVSYHFSIEQPDGTPLNSPASLLLSDEAPADPHALLYPKQVGTFQAEVGEPAGERRFTFFVRDEVNGTTAEKSITVRVADSNEPLSSRAGFGLHRLIGEYYRHPNPRLALPALVAFSHTANGHHPVEHLGAVLGFYEQIFADNPWLLPQFKKHLATTSNADERRMFALVLAFARNDNLPLDDLPPAAREALSAARHENLPFPSRKPLSGAPLDVHWGRFFASGRFAPISDLVAIAQEFAPSWQKIQELKQRGADPSTLPKAEFAEATIFEIAQWSLGSNAYYHPLVRAYLMDIERSEKTVPAVKEMLRTALNWKDPKAPAP